MRTHQHVVQAVSIQYPGSFGSIIAKIDSKQAKEKQLARIEYEFRLEIYQKIRSQIHAINAHVRTRPLDEMPELPWFKWHLWSVSNSQENVTLLYGAFDKLKVKAQRQLEIIALKHKKGEFISDKTFDRFEEDLTNLLHFLKAAKGEDFGLELKLKALDIVNPCGKKERIAQVLDNLDWALEDYLYIPKGVARAGGLKLQSRRKMQGTGLPKRQAEASSYKTLMTAEYYGLLKPHYTRLRNYWVKILNNSSDKSVNRLLFGNRFCEPRSDVIAIL